MRQNLFDEDLIQLFVVNEHKVSIWVLGDQLHKNHPAIDAAEKAHGRDHIRIVMVESQRRARRLAYHRKKLVLVFSAMRHYARRLQMEGYIVDYQQTETFLEGLKAHVHAHRSSHIYTMAASTYGGRRFQEAKLANELGLTLTILPNTQFLAEQYNPYPNPIPGKRYVMEHFYRAMRRHFGILIDESGAPVGGQWNFDKLNRKRLPKGLMLPEIPSFPPDEITTEVMKEIEESGEGFGDLASFDLAVTHEQAHEAFEDFLTRRLTNFGPYEDAMSQDHTTLFHSVLSPYLNLGLLEPLTLAQAAEDCFRAKTSPINSVEGFMRQIIGWREFIYWQYWRSMPDILVVNFWGANRPLPDWFWDGKTEINCLRYVLSRVLEQGYAHHIERLMVLSNFCLLAGLDPIAINDWFTCVFIDAYEWAMVPNVLGMGLNADGGIVATKPYIASANYINRMSNYCQSCSYNRKERTGPKACPFNTLYWNFLIRNEEVLRTNPRLGRNVLGLRHLDGAERQAVIEQAEEFLNNL
jgi:deoxyribodipyrimidine photolyase-related protein